MGQKIGTDIQKRLYNIREAAQYLGRSVWGMRDLVWKREIPVVKSAGGRKMFIDVQDLDAYISRNKSAYR